MTVALHHHHLHHPGDRGETDGVHPEDGHLHEDHRDDHRYEMRLIFQQNPKMKKMIPVMRIGNVKWVRSTHVLQQLKRKMRAERR